MHAPQSEERSWADWKAQFASCSKNRYPGPEECAQTRGLIAGLEKELTGIKVFYFGRSGGDGRVEGVSVTLLVVGKTRSGNLAGVRSLAIWT